ncbi:MAG TPA: FtsX-like permease family protein [Vicinamibacterales bacterium]
MEIVGIAGDARYSAATSEAAPAFYLPRAQHPSELICLVVEPVPGTEASVIAGLRDAVRSLDRTQPIAHITTIDQIVSDSTADRRFYAVTTGAFAAVALLLAIAGIFGTVFRIVAERQRDFAIRVALAADPRRLLRLVCGYGVSPALAGTALGLGAAYAGSRLLRSFLFEIAPTDWLTYVGAVVLIMGVTIAACYVPARRALRVEPMFVLRSD